MLVKAPKNERIKRVVTRDSVNESEVIARINNQWEDKKEKYADYVIENIGLEETYGQVKTLIKKLNNKGIFTKTTLIFIFVHDLIIRSTILYRALLILNY